MEFGNGWRESCSWFCDFLELATELAVDLCNVLKIRVYLQGTNLRMLSSWCTGIIGW